MLSQINLIELKTFLTSNNITLPTDEQLLNIITVQFNKIQAETGRELEVTSHTDVELNFNSNSNTYNVKHYPIEEIYTINVDNNLISSDMYAIDKNNGRIKFLNKLPSGDTLVIEYTSKETDNFIKSKIIPLLYDMILYDLQDDNLKNASSITEKNVSISFNTNASLNATILSRLEKLKARRGSLTRML